ERAAVWQWDVICRRKILEANSIESCQAAWAAQPQISVGRLSDRMDCVIWQAVLRCPGTGKPVRVTASKRKRRGKEHRCKHAAAPETNQSVGHGREDSKEKLQDPSLERGILLQLPARLTGSAAFTNTMYMLQDLRRRSSVFEPSVRLSPPWTW